MLHASGPDCVDLGIHFENLQTSGEAPECCCRKSVGSLLSSTSGPQGPVPQDPLLTDFFEHYNSCSRGFWFITWNPPKLSLDCGAREDQPTTANCGGGRECKWVATLDLRAAFHPTLTPGPPVSSVKCVLVVLSLLYISVIHYVNRVAFVQEGRLRWSFILTLLCLDIMFFRTIVLKEQYSTAANVAVTHALETLSSDTTIEEPTTPQEPPMIEADPADILQPSPPTDAASLPSLVVQLPEESSQGAADTHPRISERPLILYAYSDTKNARKNLEFFLAHGLHAGADFVFILNGFSDAASIIPTTSNIKYVQRPNDCYDMGAYAEVLLDSELYKRYKKFILLNASIRGPFLPYWAESCWSDMFLNRVTDEVKLVGITANCWPSFHVQSMILATDDVGINILLFPPEAAAETVRSQPSYDPISHTVTMDLPQYPGINSCFHTWGSAVAAEIGSSSLIKAAGYKLDVMMAAYHGNAKYEAECDSSVNGDVLRDKHYFGINVHPFETVFAKSNRDIDPITLERLTQWTDGRGYSSYAFCPA